MNRERGHEFFNSISAFMIPGVVSVSPKASVFEAAQKMTLHNIGMVVVLDHGRLAGVLSERDVVTRVASQGLDPVKTSVQEVMTRDLVTAKPGDLVSSVVEEMRRRHIRHMPVVEEGVRVVGVVSTRDLLARVEDNLRSVLSERGQDASLDPVTGLFNNRFFSDYLDAEIARSLRRGYFFSIVFMTPDALGRDGGLKDTAQRQELIRELSSLLKPGDGVSRRFSIRRSDIAASLRDDTLALILPETGRKGAWTCAERLRIAAEGLRYSADGRPVPVTACFGIAEFPSDATRREELLDRAERALAAALKSGGNRLVSWDTVGPEA